MGKAPAAARGTSEDRFDDEQEFDDEDETTGTDEERDERDDEDRGEDGQEADSKESETERRVRDLLDEAKKYRTKNRGLREENEALQKRLTALEKKVSGSDEETEDTSERLTQVQNEAKSLREENEALRIQYAFASNAKYQWRNPRAALKLADLSDVEIDDDGTVIGLDEALEALAKSEPYLLKNGSDGEDGEEKPRRTGASTSRRSSSSPSRDELAKKYPALRR